MLAVLAAGVAVYVFGKFDLKTGAFVWAGVVAATCALQCAIFVYRNYAHYFAYVE